MSGKKERKEEGDITLMKSLMNGAISTTLFTNVPTSSPLVLLKDFT
jgi:hypothetical protein